ncbi:endonuclease [Pseudomonas solani]|uniref:Endonuclease n=1 Tax=Pseudomonas solani TaxID=2731552 RepID=A0ABN6BNZ3_9PSED|nr:S1/P1 nuclease [Pseudomonas solani]BCD84806.1 endonuclease [Pseudomonas solani]
MQHNGFRRALGASLFIGSLLWGAQAGAWGQLGHAVVADIAEAQLTPAAKAEADRLLALVRQQHLSAVASWADNLRNMPDFQALWEQTRAQHYINYKTDDCTYQAPRDCPDGQCVVAAIERNAALLADPKANDNQKVMALMFVVHFVGDIHQPLHNSYRLDKGGNDFPVVVGGRDYNLHSVWDSYLLASRRLDQAAYTAKLSEDLPKPEVGTPASWSGESCAIVRDDDLYPKTGGKKAFKPDAFKQSKSEEWARRGTQGGDEDGEAGGNQDTLDRRYLKKFLPLAERRVQEAGIRLALLLNANLPEGAPKK